MILVNVEPRRDPRPFDRRMEPQVSNEVQGNQRRAVSTRRHMRSSSPVEQTALSYRDDTGLNSGYRGQKGDL